MCSIGLRNRLSDKLPVDILIHCVSYDDEDILIYKEWGRWLG